MSLNHLHQYFGSPTAQHFSMKSSSKNHFWSYPLKVQILIEIEIFDVSSKFMNTVLFLVIKLHINILFRVIFLIFISREWRRSHQRARSRNRLLDRRHCQFARKYLIIEADHFGARRWSLPTSRSSNISKDKCFTQDEEFK